MSLLKIFGHIHIVIACMKNTTSLWALWLCMRMLEAASAALLQIALCEKFTCRRHEGIANEINGKVGAAARGSQMRVATQGQQRLIWYAIVFSTLSFQPADNFGTGSDCAVVRIKVTGGH